VYDRPVFLCAGRAGKISKILKIAKYPVLGRVGIWAKNKGRDGLQMANKWLKWAVWCVIGQSCETYGKVWKSKKNEEKDDKFNQFLLKTAYILPVLMLEKP
jgi:hypothetical protein